MCVYLADKTNNQPVYHVYKSANLPPTHVFQPLANDLIEMMVSLFQEFIHLIDPLDPFT